MYKTWNYYMIDARIHVNFCQRVATNIQNIKCMYHTPKGAPWPVGKYIRRRTHTAAKYIEPEIKQNLSNELYTPIAHICIS